MRSGAADCRTARNFLMVFAENWVGGLRGERRRQGENPIDNDGPDRCNRVGRRACFSPSAADGGTAVWLTAHGGRPSRCRSGSRPDFKDAASVAEGLGW